MKTSRKRMVTGLGAICWVMPILGANAPDPGGGSSAMLWMTLLLPTVLIVLIFYSILRHARGNQAIADRSVERFEEHRRFTEEHMGRVESQLDRLDERLARVVELLLAIEQGQRQDRG